MREKIAPLSGSFLLLGMFGLLFSFFFLLQYTVSWAYAIGFLSFLFIIASMISTTYAPVEEELALDNDPFNREGRVQILSKEEYEKRKK